MADSTVHNLCLFLPLWHVKSWMESWNELKCVSEIFYLIFNQCWVVDSSLVKRVLCKSSLLRSRFCRVTQRSSCDSSIQEVACPSGYKRSRPSPTIGGQQWQLLLLDVFFSFVRLVMYRSNRCFNMPPPGIPRAFDTFAVPGRREFDYQSLPGGGEFDPQALGVGNLNCTLDFM